MHQYTRYMTFLCPPCTRLTRVHHPHRLPFPPSPFSVPSRALRLFGGAMLTTARSRATLLVHPQGFRCYPHSAHPHRYPHILALPSSECGRHRHRQRPLLYHACCRRSIRRSAVAGTARVEPVGHRRGCCPARSRLGPGRRPQRRRARRLDANPREPLCPVSRQPRVRHRHRGLALRPRPRPVNSQVGSLRHVVAVSGHARPGRAHPRRLERERDRTEPLVGQGGPDRRREQRSRDDGRRALAVRRVDSEYRLRLRPGGEPRPGRPEPAWRPVRRR